MFLVGIWIFLLFNTFLFLTACENNARHSIEITEPTDHTLGDDGGKLKYKIIWGNTTHKE